MDRRGGPRLLVRVGVKMQLDLDEIEARMRTPRPEQNTPEFWVWLSQIGDDHRALIAEVRMLRQLCGTMMQEGAGRLD